MEFRSADPYFSCTIEELPDAEGASVEAEALVRSIHSGFENYVKLNKEVPPELFDTITSIPEAGKLADTIVSHLNLKLEVHRTTPSPSARIRDCER